MEQPSGKQLEIKNIEDDFVEISEKTVAPPPEKPTIQTPNLDQNSFLNRLLPCFFPSSPPTQTSTNPSTNSSPNPVHLKTP